MKIGILTHHYINNFGAFLQTYALQEAIKEMYPKDEVYVINAINLKHFVINTGGWFRFYKDRENFKAWIEKIHLPSTFYKARKQYLNLTKRCYSTKEINKLGLDCIVIGSDEVWNYQEGKGNAAVKFGEGLDCKKLIAYAPSVGKSCVTEQMPQYIKSGLERFHAISSRDDLTEEFVEKTVNIKPKRVLDPTFMAPFPQENYKKAQTPYIMFYYCDGIPNELKKQIVDEAHRKGMKVYGAGECDKKYSDITVNLTPFEWIGMFRNAEFVFTGTFHGAVFSILNHRQFQVYMTNQSRIKKITSLLNQFAIDLKSVDLMQGNKPFEEKISYHIVDEHIDALRKQSREFLESIGEE